MLLVAERAGKLQPRGMAGESTLDASTYRGSKCLPWKGCDWIAVSPALDYFQPAHGSPLTI